MFFVTRYYIKWDKMAEYQKWLLSDEAKDLRKRFEEETSWKYVNTYFPILGFGEDIIEDWFEVPNWAALDKSRMSNVWEEWSDKTWDFMDMTRSAPSVVYRTTSDIMIPTPPKKK